MQKNLTMHQTSYSRMEGTNVNVMTATINVSVQKIRVGRLVVRQEEPIHKRSSTFLALSANSKLLINTLHVIYFIFDVLHSKSY